MHKQLQDFLNECIKKGWKPRGEVSDKCVVNVSTGINTFYYTFQQVHWNVPQQPSIHDLFSIESGLMEFVRWKELHYVLPVPLAHYINMCQMSADQKIQYFLDNALLPE